MATEQVAIKDFTLTQVVRHVSHMKLNLWNSTERVNQCNVPWFISFMQTPTHFLFFVNCDKTRGNAEWSFSTRIRTSYNSSVGTYCFKVFIAKYDNRTECVGHGISDCIHMQELRQKLLIKDEVVLEAKVEILEMTGIEIPPILRSFDDNEAKHMSDATLLVEDQRFYVAKFTLALQSTYFKSLFFGNFKESKESEITLKDIDVDVFQVYLEVLNAEEALTDSCVEEVLELSQLYDTKNVTQICVDFLRHWSKLSNKNKLQIGSRFDLKELKKSCLDSLKTAADVRACLDCGGLQNGIKDPEVLRSLVEKTLSFMRLPVNNSLYHHNHHNHHNHNHHVS